MAAHEDDRTQKYISAGKLSANIFTRPFVVRKRRADSKKLYIRISARCAVIQKKGNERLVIETYRNCAQTERRIYIYIKFRNQLLINFSKY